MKRGVRERIQLVPETAPEWILYDHHAALHRANAHRPFEHFDAARAGRGVSPLDAPQIARMSFIARDRARDRAREKETYCTLQANFLHRSQLAELAAQAGAINASGTIDW